MDYTAARGIEAIVADLCSNNEIKLCVEMQPWVTATPEHKRDQGGRNIQHTFDGSHREAGERSRIVRFVVMLVDPAIKEGTNVAVCEAILVGPPRVHIAVDEPKVKNSPVEHRHRPQ
eukprot:SAG31_NODE_3342_length_4383_cov_5.306723_3_plen_117_part_00